MGGPAAAASQGAPSSEPAKIIPAQGPIDACEYTDRRPNLQRGSSGSAVRQVQCYLNEAIDAGLREDGRFGGQTRNAVRDFQQCADITVDGRVGSQSWSFLSFWANDPGRPFFC
jgi:peptidoglycan hydrolase-like protein with peptidoglycan-binding domain